MPLEYELMPWQVWCYRVPRVIADLNDIQFSRPPRGRGLPTGQRLPVLAGARPSAQGHHRPRPVHPLPEISRAPAQAAASGPSGCPSFELHPGWEYLSATYEATIQRHAAAMPLVCTAGAEQLGRCHPVRSGALAPPLLGVPAARGRQRNAVHGEVRPADRGLAALWLHLPVPNQPRPGQPPTPWPSTSSGCPGERA